MAYTLAEAARVTGKSRATLSSAIKSGRIAAVKDAAGTLHIDPAELHRVYPRASPPAPETAAPVSLHPRGTDTSVIAAVVRKAAVPMAHTPVALHTVPRADRPVAPDTAPAAAAPESVPETVSESMPETVPETVSLHARLDAALGRLADKDAIIADLREDRDRWRQQATALLAPVPSVPPRKGLFARLFGR